MDASAYVTIKIRAESRPKLKTLASLCDAAMIDVLDRLLETELRRQGIEPDDRLWTYKDTTHNQQETK